MANLYIKKIEISDMDKAQRRLDGTWCEECDNATKEEYEKACWACSGIVYYPYMPVLNSTRSIKGNTFTVDDYTFEPSIKFKTRYGK